jgi:DNA-directed RNA polymerase specialized sigma24 family protein
VPNERSRSISVPVRIDKMMPRMWPLRRKPTPTLERTGERELIGLARGGSGAVFGEVMSRNNRRLFRAARAIIGTDWEAEEVVQDAYVRAFRGLGAFREEAALGTWLTRIVINEAEGRLRGRRETLPLTELDDRAWAKSSNFRGRPHTPTRSARGMEGAPMISHHRQSLARVEKIA